MYSKHPYKPFIPQEATKLIIGTMPPYRFCIEPKELNESDVNFYYGSNDNHFWKLMEVVTGVKLEYKNTEEAVNQRKALLSKLKIGITDIVEQCIHENGSPEDTSLKDITPKPLKELLLENPKIDTLIYTNKTGKIILEQVNKIADKSYHEGWDASQTRGTVIINNKKYNVIKLFSPSPSARRKVSYEAQLSQYKEVFGR